MRQLSNFCNVKRKNKRIMHLYIISSNGVECKVVRRGLIFGLMYTHIYPHWNIVFNAVSHNCLQCCQHCFILDVRFLSHLKPWRASARDFSIFFFPNPDPTFNMRQNPSSASCSLSLMLCVSLFFGLGVVVVFSAPLGIVSVESSSSFW